MHTSSQSPLLRDVPDVTCPSDAPTDQKRREVVHSLIILQNPMIGSLREHSLVMVNPML